MVVKKQRRLERKIKEKKKSNTNDKRPKGNTREREVRASRRGEIKKSNTVKRGRERG